MRIGFLLVPLSTFFFKLLPKVSKDCLRFLMKMYNRFFSLFFPSGKWPVKRYYCLYVTYNNVSLVFKWIKYRQDSLLAGKIFPTRNASTRRRIMIIIRRVSYNVHNISYSEYNVCVIYCVPMCASCSYVVLTNEWKDCSGLEIWNVYCLPVCTGSLERSGFQLYSCKIPCT